MKLRGKTALVTGSSMGIGKSIAITLAREGANIIVNYIGDDDSAEEVISEVRLLGRKAISVKVDVSNRVKVEKMIQKSIAEFDTIDILVNNAGISYQDERLLINDDKIEEMLDVNFKGVLYCSLAVAKHMKRKRSGKIINISSASGTGTSAPRETYYAASKAAVNVLTKRFALELGTYGICVNAVAPGMIKTAMSTELLDSVEKKKLIKLFSEKTMLRKVGEPQDVANITLFLASEESNYLTGQIIAVDGGRTDYLSHSM